MDLEFIKKELSRCIGCKVTPCAKACPLGVSPHDFIAFAKNGDLVTSAQIIREKNPLAQTCGLVCPDKFCQKNCIRAKIDKAIEIPCLQAHITNEITNTPLTLPPFNGKKVAIIGGGPAGLGALWEFIKNGWHVTLFEEKPYLGGATRLIPTYRLPKEVLDKEINNLINNELVTVKLNTKITDFQELKKDFESIVLAIGEPNLRKLNITGEEYCTSYKDVLSTPNNHLCDKVCVVGGGEVALDCALTLKKLGAQTVEMFVRRTQKDMRIMKRDFEELNSHNIIIRDLISITNISNQNNSYQLTTIRNQINSEGKAIPASNDLTILSGYDKVILALGSTYSKDESLTDIYMAGDMTGTCGTVVQALASGRDVAREIISNKG